MYDLEALTYDFKSYILLLREANQATKPAAAPEVKFKNLLAAIGTKNTSHQPPFEMVIDYLPASGPSTTANITIQFENRNLHFQAGDDGGKKSVVNLLGRVDTMTGRPVALFERRLEINVPPGLEQSAQISSYQYPVRLSPGRYRLDIVAEDTATGRLNTHEEVLEVPHFDEDKLASSTLILADTIQKLPTKSLAADAMYPIGDTKIRPRVGNRFTSQEKLGIYLQVYNLKPDESSNKPVGSIEYEIDKAASNEKVMGVSEDIGAIPNASASQVTIAKLLPLRTFQPGRYTLRVTVADRNGSQTLQRQEDFTVSPE